MLWYKAWLETRARFLTSLVTVTLFCTVFVYHAQGMIRAQWTWDLNRLLLVNQEFLVILWVLSVVLLAMGGIVREKAVGTASFTLALPVSRMRLVSARVAVGALESMALAVVPWVAVVIVMVAAKKPVLVSQVAEYVTLLVVGGMIYFALGILVSSVVGGEYTAPALTFGVVLAVVIVSDAWFREYSVWRLVTGDLLVDRGMYLLPARLPWLGLGASLGVALLMVGAAMVVVEKRDF